MFLGTRWGHGLGSVASLLTVSIIILRAENLLRISTRAPFLMLCAGLAEHMHGATIPPPTICLHVCSSPTPRSTGGSLYKLEDSTAESTTLTGLLRHCEATSATENEDFPVKLIPCPSTNAAHPRRRKAAACAVPEPVGNESLVASWDVDEVRAWLYDRELLHTELMDCDGAALLALDSTALAALGVTHRTVAAKILRAVNQAADRPNNATANQPQPQPQQIQQQHGFSAIAAAGEGGAARLAIVRQNGLDHAVDASTGQVVRVLSPEEAESLVALGRQQQLYGGDANPNHIVNRSSSTKSGARGNVKKMKTAPSDVNRSSFSSSSYRRSHRAHFESGGAHGVGGGSAGSGVAIAGGYRICKANGVVSIVNAGSGRPIHSFPLKVDTKAAPSAQPQATHHHHHHHHHHHNAGERQNGRHEKPSKSYRHGRRHSGNKPAPRPLVTARVGRVVVMDDPSPSKKSSKKRDKRPHMGTHTSYKNGADAGYVVPRVDADVAAAAAMSGGGAYDDLAETLTHSVQQGAFGAYAMLSAVPTVKINDGDGNANEVDGAATVAAIDREGDAPPFADVPYAVESDAADAATQQIAAVSPAISLPSSSTLSNTVDYNESSSSGGEVIVDSGDGDGGSGDGGSGDGGSGDGDDDGESEGGGGDGEGGGGDGEVGGDGGGGGGRDDAGGYATGGRFPATPLIRIGSGSILSNFLYSGATPPSPEPSQPAGGDGVYYDAATMEQSPANESSNSGPIYATVIDTPQQNESDYNADGSGIYDIANAPALYNADGSGIYDIANAPDTPSEGLYSSPPPAVHVGSGSAVDAPKLKEGTYLNSFGMVVVEDEDGADDNSAWQEAV